MGFFAWIREGVRRAVLLGFTDAVEEIGKRSPDEDLSPQMAASLREKLAVPVESAATPKLAANNRTGGRKRLGRSLEQIQTAGKPA